MLAEAFIARLTVVHVLGSDEMTSVKLDEEKVRKWIAPEVQEVCFYRELVVRGSPAARVLDCAEDLGSDLLVVGAQHKLLPGLSHLGSTTERLIRLASVPVLVVPHLPAPTAGSVEEERGELVGAGS